MIKPFQNSQVPKTSKEREQGYIKAAFFHSVPLAVCLILLFALGYIYIRTFAEGPVYSFCYIVLPVLIGAFSTAFFWRLGVSKLSSATVREKAFFLGFFVIHILALSWGKPIKPSPELLILYIPAAYALYVGILPCNENSIIKPAICGLFWIGAVILSMLRPTSYAGDGLLAIHFSLFMISISGVKRGAFGYESKWKKYAALSIIFAVSCLIIPFEGIVSFAEAPHTSLAEVTKNVGTMPSLLICILYMAVIVLGFLLVKPKSPIMAYISIATVSSLGLILGLNILSAANIIATRFGLALFESSELTSSFGVLLTIIVCSPNGAFLSDHAFFDSIIFNSLYRGWFRDESYGPKLLLLEGPDYSRTQFIKEVIMAGEPGFSLYLKMDAVYDRILQEIRDNGLSQEFVPDTIFPEVKQPQQDEVALIVIDDVNCLAGKPTTQAAIADLILAILEDLQISVVLAGVDMAKRTPTMWNKLTDRKSEKHYSISREKL